MDLNKAGLHNRCSCILLAVPLAVVGTFFLVLFCGILALKF